MPGTHFKSEQGSVNRLAVKGVPLQILALIHRPVLDVEMAGWWHSREAMTAVMSVPGLW